MSTNCYWHQFNTSRILQLGVQLRGRFYAVQKVPMWYSTAVEQLGFDMSLRLVLQLGPYLARSSVPVHSGLLQPALANQDRTTLICYGLARQDVFWKPKSSMKRESTFSEQGVNWHIKRSHCPWDWLVHSHTNEDSKSSQFNWSKKKQLFWLVRMKLLWLIDEDANKNIAVQPWLDGESFSLIAEVQLRELLYNGWLRRQECSEGRKTGS